MHAVIEARHLSKTYRVYDNPYDQLWERLPWNRGKPARHRAVHALQDVSFDVRRGECMGLVGKNGAGKSTLLKVLSGTTFPTRGSYTVNGRVTSLLELGAGFHQHFSGRENIYMNAAMLGFSQREANARYDDIVAFSELGEFIDSPVRTYSSGMVARLAFSVAVATEPDLLIIDEILAVGDMNFQRKCVERIWRYKQEGRSLLFCSHSLYDVRQLCERAIWMRRGQVQLLADAVTVTNEYASFAAKASAEEEAAAKAAHPEEPGSDQPRVLSAVIVDPGTGAPRNRWAPGDSVAVRVHVGNPRREPLTIAVGVVRGDSTLCFAHSTQHDGVPFAHAEGIATLHIDGLCLLSGDFTVAVWLLDDKGVHRLHERPTTENLIVANRTREEGMVRQAHHWTVQPLGG